MKKIIFVILTLFAFVKSVSASETFYLGDHVPDIYIYMDRINKKVYRQFRMIYRTNTNELVYCIEPGASLSSGYYDDYNDFNSIFNISIDKFNKIKLIAYYGYNYKNHTDVKWYAITQYIIWKEIMPYNWEMYFVDSNHNKIDGMFDSEISEIYSLVNNHDDSLGILDNYVINNEKSITIKSKTDLSKYKSSIGTISNNEIKIDNLSYGRNDISLTFENYNSPLFYFNNNGQNILKRGDVFKKVINTYIYVQGGKIKVNECNEETFSDDFLGGTYEILDQDDEVIGEVTCEDTNCISENLPVGFHKIRVKKLPDNYEVNEHIYDVEVVDNDIAEVSICSLPKKIQLRSVPEEPIVEELAINDNRDEKVIDKEYISIPYTSKSSCIKYIIGFIIPILYFISILKHEDNF